MKIAFFIVAYMLATIAMADDFKTTNGKEYKGVTITKVKPDGITVMTDDGIEKIYFAILPKDIQTKYGYDPQKAAAYAAADAAAQAAMFEKNEQAYSDYQKSKNSVAIEMQKQDEAEADAIAQQKAKDQQETASHANDPEIYYPDAHNGSGQ